jgi:hypothetical protein
VIVMPPHIELQNETVPRIVTRLQDTVYFLMSVKTFRRRHSTKKLKKCVHLKIYVKTIGKLK